MIQSFNPSDFVLAVAGWQLGKDQNCDARFSSPISRTMVRTSCFWSSLRLMINGKAADFNR